MVCGGDAKWKREGAGISRVARFSALALCFLVTNCASSSKFAAKVDPKYGVASSPRVVDFGEPVPKGGGTYRVGKPYVVAGQTYVPEEKSDYKAEGLASWYGDDFHGRRTANGEIFDMEAISAAHPTLPMPSYVRVTNLATKRSIIVRVNDRGPYHGNRVIDLSYKTAQLLGFRDHGVARVRVEYVGRAPLEGSDERTLIASLRQGQPAPAPFMVASSRSFIPTPDRSSPLLRGAVPVPGERPYTLGEARAETAAYRSPAIATDMAALSRPTRSVTFTPPEVSPVSAYAATRYNASIAVMSGRGLY